MIAGRKGAVRMLFRMLGILLGCAVLCLHTVRVVARRTRLCPLTAEEVTVYLLTALELALCVFSLIGTS